MTHYDIDYSKLSEAEKQSKAIDDIKDYMGIEKFNHVYSQFVELHKVKPMTEETLGFYLMLAGISGYPVKAWFNLIESEAKK